MVIKIRTVNGHECLIEEEDLKHYKGAVRLDEEAVDPDSVPEDTDDE